DEELNQRRVVGRGRQKSPARPISKSSGAAEGGKQPKADRRIGESIGGATAPAGAGPGVGAAILPLVLLVRVRKQLIRARFTARLIICARKRNDQRPNVADHRQLSLSPVLLQLGQVGMQAERSTSATGRVGRKRQQSILGNRQAG